MQVFEVKGADGAEAGADHLVIATGNDGQYYKSPTPAPAPAPAPTPVLPWAHVLRVSGPESESA